MTPAEILTAKVREARTRFRYIPDESGPDALTALLNDVWDTAEEMEQRKGGDCDGYACWAAQRGFEMAAGFGEWRVIVGEVYQRGAWSGHMWVALIDEQGTELWADPCWGIEPQAPEWLGYPDTRRPIRRWTHLGDGHFDHQQDYPPVQAGKGAV